jgi:ketosteroid isomerase-like protein
MRPTLAAVCVLAAALPLRLEAQPADPEIVEAIRRVEETLVQARQARDAAAAMDAYAVDIVLFPAGEEPLHGKAEVRRWLGSRMASSPPVSREQFETATLEACGDLAVETGAVAAEEMFGGSRRTVRTPRLAVWKRQTDGTWKIAREALGGAGSPAMMPAGSAAPAIAAPPASAAAVPPPPPEPPRVVVLQASDVIPIPDPRSLSDGFVRTISDRLRSRAARIRSLEASGNGGEALRAAISKADHELQATIRDVGWIDVARFGVATSCDAAYVVSVSDDPALVRSAVPWMKDLQTNPEAGACYARALEAYGKLPPK